MTTKRQWESLESHPFCRRVWRNWAQVLARYLPTEKDLEHLQKYGRPRRHPVPSYDSYFIQVANRLLNVFNTLWKIEASTIFLRQYPYKRTLAKFHITRDRYMMYHLETYYVSVASCVDRVALLVNDVFGLGLPTKLAQVSILLKMDQLKNSNVGKALQDLYNSLKKERQLKNLITHEAEIEDPDLSHFVLYHFVMLNDKAPKGKDWDPVTLQRLARSSLRVYLRKKGLEMNRINHRLQEKLGSVFDELQHDFHYTEPLPDKFREVFLKKVGTANSTEKD